MSIKARALTATAGLLAIVWGVIFLGGLSEGVGVTNAAMWATVVLVFMVVVSVATWLVMDWIYRGESR